VAGWQCPACKPLDLPLVRWLAKLVRRAQPVIPQTCILRPVVHDATARAPKALLAACACPKVLVSGAALDDLPRARCRRFGLIQSSGPRCCDGPPTMQAEPGRPKYCVHSQLARKMSGQTLQGSLCTCHRVYHDSAGDVTCWGKKTSQTNETDDIPCFCCRFGTI
jgi:hypothetical protein